MCTGGREETAVGEGAGKGTPSRVGDRNIAFGVPMKLANKWPRWLISWVLISRGLLDEGRLDLTERGCDSSIKMYMKKVNGYKGSVQIERFDITVQKKCDGVIQRCSFVWVVGEKK